MITDLPTNQQSAFKRYHGDKYFSECFPTRRRQKSTGTDMEQNRTSLSSYVYRPSLLWRFSDFEAVTDHKLRFGDDVVGI